MIIGALTATFRNFPFEEALDFIADLGVKSIEFGGYSFEDHYGLEDLLENASMRKELKKSVEQRGLFISALNMPMGNALHPQEEIAQKHRKTIESTIKLADLLEVDRVVTFSGQPGDWEGAKNPFWIPLYRKDEILEWQWREKAIPYWQKAAGFAEKYGVKICLEMHAPNLVYNPPTLMRLREEVGDAVGTNLDFSHLFWQGIDPVRAIKVLGKAIYYTHFKDTRIDVDNCSIKGVLDTTPSSDVANRSWVFALIGNGHDYKTWKDIVRALRLTGYDYVLSIEHEELLMSVKEGFRKAVSFLKEIVIEEKADKKWY